MINKPFTSTELKASKDAVFVNGDDAAADKVLTDDHVAKVALRAVFRDRPAYFSRRSPEVTSSL